MLQMKIKTDFEVLPGKYVYIRKCYRYVNYKIRKTILLCIISGLRQFCFEVCFLSNIIIELHNIS